MGMLNVREGFDYRLHFLSLATGGPHRLSVSPVILKLNSIWHDEMRRPPIELSIGYRHVGVLLIQDLHGTANELWVVQWDTAVIKIVSINTHDHYVPQTLMYSHSIRHSTPLKVLYPHGLPDQITPGLGTSQPLSVFSTLPPLFCPSPVVIQGTRPAPSSG